MKEWEKIRLQFLGGVGTVTGSKTLVSDSQFSVLVDCGLFQGLKNLRLKNWEKFPVDPQKINAVLLTHAHLDHSGYLPRLVQMGFHGPIFCNKATYELCRILLMDSAFLMAEEAGFLNRKKITKHQPADALYSMEDVQRTLDLFVPVQFHSSIEIKPGWNCEFLPTGHILGASMISLKAGGRSILFSGDIGRYHDPIFCDPTPPPPADVLIIESTYGNRTHPSTNGLRDLKDLVQRVYQRQGVLLIPAFAVGRAQHLIHAFSTLKKNGELPDIPIYLNSPMAISATELFFKNPQLHRLDEHECREMARNVRFIHTAEDSRLLNERHGPMIIISASGMLTGGRILHHLDAFAEDPKNMILLAGFQAAGTRGRTLADGGKELKLHGRYLTINAEVQMLENFSAHGDRDEILRWVQPLKSQKGMKVFVNHGEASAADELRRRLSEQLNADCLVPEPFVEYELP